MSQPETIYDSTDIQLRSLGDMATGKLTIDDLAKPEIVQLVLERHMVTLTELKQAKIEVTDLGKEIKRLTEDREGLRVGMAKAEQRQSILLLEIPIGFLSGFAINMLTTSVTSGVGWFLLAISIIMLLFVRSPRLLESFRKEKQDAEKRD